MFELLYAKYQVLLVNASLVIAISVKFCTQIMKWQHFFPYSYILNIECCCHLVTQLYVLVDNFLDLFLQLIDRISIYAQIQILASCLWFIPSEVKFTLKITKRFFTTILFS